MRDELSKWINKLRFLGDIVEATEIGGEVYLDKLDTNCIKIEIPEGVTVIQSKCMVDNTELEYIKLHDSVRFIRNNAFHAELKGVNIPKKTNYLYKNTFRGNANLEISLSSKLRITESAIQYIDRLKINNSCFIFYIESSGIIESNIDLLDLRNAQVQSGAIWKCVIDTVIINSDTLEKLEAFKDCKIGKLLLEHTASKSEDTKKIIARLNSRLKNIDKLKEELKNELSELNLMSEIGYTKEVKEEVKRRIEELHSLLEIGHVDEIKGVVNINDKHSV